MAVRSRARQASILSATGSLTNHVRKMLCERLETRINFDAPGATQPLLFDDEFNGNTLNAQWSKQLAYAGDTGDYHHEGAAFQSYLTDDNVTVAGGALHLTTKKADVTAGNGRVFHYTEGFISSYDSFFAKSGYIEARIRFPDTVNSLHDAFRLFGYTAPPESDVADYTSSDNDLHQGTSFGASANTNAGFDDRDRTNLNMTGFHTYAVEYGGGEQTYFIDGVAQFSVNAANVPTQPMYLTLNSGVASDPGADSGFTDNSMDVDYVRVYAYDPAAGGALGSSYGFESGNGANIGAGWTAGVPDPNTGQPGGPPPGSPVPGADAVRVINRPAQANTGNKFLEITGGDANGIVTRNLTGLNPDTDYVLEAWVKSPSPADAGKLSTVGLAAGDVSVTAQGNGAWSRTVLQFTTGPNETEVEIKLSKVNGMAAADFDDVRLRPTPDPVAPYNAPVVTGIADQGLYYDGSVHAVLNATTGMGATITNFILATDTAATAGATAEQKAGDLFPQSNIVITGTGNGSTLDLFPALAKGGITHVTVYAIDSDGNVGHTTFKVTVLPFPGTHPTDPVTGNKNPNTIRVIRHGFFIDEYVDNTTTTPSAHYLFAGLTSNMSVIGSGGNDTLIVDYTGGPLINNLGFGVTLDGGFNTTGDTLTVRTGTNVTVTLGQDSVTVGTETVPYKNIETFLLDAGSNADNFRYDNPKPLMPLSFSVAGGTIKLARKTQLPPRTDIKLAGGTFDLNDQSEIINSLTGSDGVVKLGKGNLSVGQRDGSFKFNGSITGTGKLLKIGTGALTLTGSNSFTGGLTVDQGIVRLYNADAVGAGPLTLNGSTRAYLAPGLAQPVRIAGLKMSATSTFDIADNDVLIASGATDDAVYPALVKAVAHAYNGAQWNHAGITSSFARNGQGKYTIAIADAPSYIKAVGRSFDNVAVPADGIVLKYTAAADANFDGTVNNLDYSIFSSNYAPRQHGKTFLQGDFNFDGVINFKDRAIFHLSDGVSA